MQFVGKMLLYFWEKLACESIPKPKLQQVGQKLKRLFIGQTCSEQNLNCRTLRNSNMPPLAASEAKSLTVGKRQGHRPAFHQNNPNILVKIQTDSSMSPVNVLEGNFGLTPPLSIGPCCRWNRSRSRRLARVSACSGPCSSCREGGTERAESFADLRDTHMLAGLNDFTLAPSGSKPELATPNAMIPKYQIIRSKIVLVSKSRCMNIQ